MSKIIKTHTATKKNFNMINGNLEKLETCWSVFFRLLRIRKLRCKFTKTL